MTSLIEPGTRDTASPEELQHRREVARTTFQELPHNLRKRLISAASVSRMVREQINDGRWLSAVRALRGLSLRDETNRYLVLADAFETYIPYLLGD